MHEITGVFSRERHRFENPDGDVIIGVLQDETVIKGPAIDTETLRSGVRYRFYGKEVVHPAHGKQFQFNSYSPETPYGKSETCAYLTLLEGVGPATAAAIWNKFQEKSIETLKEHPEECAGLGRQFSSDKALTASRCLKMWEKTEHVKVSLIGLFEGRGFPKKTVQRAIEAGGTAAADIIRRNPYWMIQFPGCGFGNVDKLYVELANKLPPEQRIKRLNRIKRQALCMYYDTKTNSEGHTWFDGEQIINRLHRNLSGALVRAKKAIRAAVKTKLMVIKRDCPNCFGKKKCDNGTECPVCRGTGGKAFMTDSQKASAEYAVANSITRLIQSTEPIEWPDAAGLVAEADAAYEFYSQNQLPEARKALSSRICVLSGSPGTGKTFVASRITKKIIRTFGSSAIALCAPTGKAAQRLNEMLALSGIKTVTATTIHRLLGVCAAKDGQFNFVHDAGNPLPQKFIIVDESSMIDVSLMSSLLSAVSDKSHIILIGDTNQLSPVGHGCPLRDLIRSRVCGIGELTEIRRNSGKIVEACKEIREKHTLSVSKRLDLASGENLVMSECKNAEEQVERIVTLIQKLSAGGKYDAIWDCQVLVAVNDNGPVCRKALNNRLQQLLNPNGEMIEGNPFRVGDKIINGRNNWYTVYSGTLESEDTNESGQVFVANGEMGKVTEVYRGYTVVKIANRKVWIRIPNAKRDEGEEGSGSTWDLAYAISGHKSQGSEWPIGIVVIDESTGANMVCSREWLYTCISRFKSACVMVGKLSVARSFCLRSSVNARKTFLVERIKELSKRASGKEIAA